MYDPRPTFSCQHRFSPEPSVVPRPGFFLETDEQIIARKNMARQVAAAWSSFRPKEAARDKAWKHRSTIRFMSVGEKIHEGDMHRTKSGRFTMAPPHHVGQSVLRANFYRTTRPVPKPFDPRSIIDMTDLI